MNYIGSGPGFSAKSVIDAVGTDTPTGPRTRAELGEQAKAVASRLSDRPIHPVLVTGVVRLIELFAVGLIGAAVHGLYVAPEPFGWLYGLPLIAVSVVSVLFIQAADGYSLPALRTHVSQLGRIFAAWTLVFALFLGAIFFTKLGHDYSRVWLGSWYLAGLVFFAGFRLTLAALVRGWTKAGRLNRRAVIVGGGKSAEELILALEAQPGNDIRICGVFDDRKDDRSPEIVAGYPKLGTVAELVEFGRLARIDMLIVSLPLTAETRLLQMLKQLWVLPVDIRLSAHSNKLRFRPRSYSYVGAVPLLDIFDRPIGEWDALVKRGFDIVAAGLALLLLSPVMLGAALAIRLDTPGPVLFRQKRYGFNNEVINVLKFRSMHHHLADPEAKVVVSRNDPRVTRVGHFIRKTSIDELPQLINVLKGELSLVGPRPHAVNAHTANRLWEEVVDGYFARHRVKPGVTGWAQINGWRGEVDTPEKIRRRVEYDLYYIENWSVLFDVYICLMTPLKLFQSENAY